MESLRQLQQAFFAKAQEFDRVLKMGRTHLQDAVPMSLGQEFHGWGTTIGEEVSVSPRCGAAARDQPGRHRDRHHGDGRSRLPRARDQAPLRYHRHQVHPRGGSDRGDVGHGSLRALVRRAQAHVVKLTKICNDIRLLASGPRCGFNEINLPQMQPGSSIMPGKVNPVMPEVVNQVGFLVIGLDLTVTLAASAGQLQLNVMEPVITYALFTSIATMENAVNCLRVHCIDGITANAERTRDMVLNSLGIVTLLKPSSATSSAPRSLAKATRPARGCTRSS